MKPYTVTLAFVALTVIALVQADLSALTQEIREQLTATEDTIEGLVEEVHSKGPEFAKCSIELVAAKDKAFAAAHAAIDACQVKAAQVLATLPCITKDVACQNLTEEFKVKTLAEAGRCMIPAVRSVDPIVAELSSAIVECDHKTSEIHPALPTGRRSWWVRNRRKVWRAVGRVAINQLIGR